MTRLTTRFAIMFVLVAGCAAEPAAQRTAQIGMSEDEVRQVYDPVSIDTGVIYWGGSGSRRIYWQLDPQTQVWAEIGLRPEARVIALGPREPKQVWVRHGGDSITVDQPTSGADAAPDPSGLLPPGWLRSFGR